MPHRLLFFVQCRDAYHKRPQTACGSVPRRVCDDMSCHRGQGLHVLSHVAQMSYPKWHVIAQMGQMDRRGQDAIPAHHSLTGRFNGCYSVRCAYGEHSLPCMQPNTPYSTPILVRAVLMRGTINCLHLRSTREQRGTDTHKTHTAGGETNIHSLDSLVAFPRCVLYICLSYTAVRGLHPAYVLVPAPLKAASGIGFLAINHMKTLPRCGSVEFSCDLHRTPLRAQGQPQE
jgi:hypothetical protein